ncbi:polymer-forming cytoskeletal protein [bacterium]|nr:polymer-forming cytoskeletal protein [bacterium]MBU1959555.1 polymer-forming cytoskeletal protein [bacterium]
MALFKSNQKSGNVTKVVEPTSNATFVSQGLEVTGNFKGTGSVQIEGTLHGNITVNSVVIGESGVVNGIIDAKYIVINGKLNGSIICDSLEIMQNGHVSNTIKVKKIIISGKAEGEINAEEEISIMKEGKVKASQMRSKKITVNGSFLGNVTASELLEIGENGSVEGEITVKNIKTHEGGKLVGSMHTYQEIKEEIKKEEIKKEESPKTPKTSK